MVQLTRMQSPAVALVLLRFCMGWCQLSYRARTMPLERNRHSLISNNAP